MNIIVLPGKKVSSKLLSLTTQHFTLQLIFTRARNILKYFMKPF